MKVELHNKRINKMKREVKSHIRSIRMVIHCPALFITFFAVSFIILMGVLIYEGSNYTTSKVPTLADKDYYVNGTLVIQKGDILRNETGGIIFEKHKDRYIDESESSKASSSLLFFMTCFVICALSIGICYKVRENLFKRLCNKYPRFDLNYRTICYSPFCGMVRNEVKALIKKNTNWPLIKKELTKAKISENPIYYLGEYSNDVCYDGTYGVNGLVCPVWADRDKKQLYIQVSRYNVFLRTIPSTKETFDWFIREYGECPSSKPIAIEKDADWRPF